MALACGLAGLQWTSRSTNGVQRLAARWFASEAGDIKRFCVVGAGPAGFYTADRVRLHMPGLHPPSMRDGMWLLWTSNFKFK